MQLSSNLAVIGVIASCLLGSAQDGCSADPTFVDVPYGQACGVCTSVPTFAGNSSKNPALKTISVSQRDAACTVTLHQTFDCNDPGFEAGKTQYGCWTPDGGIAGYRVVCPDYLEPKTWDVSDTTDKQPVGNPTTPGCTGSRCPNYPYPEQVNPCTSKYGCKDPQPVPIPEKPEGTSCSGDKCSTTPPCRDRRCTFPEPESTTKTPQDTTCQRPSCSPPPVPETPPVESTYERSYNTPPVPRPRPTTLILHT
ncbi:hypothetical protein B0H66DRAFT_618212 [Apodospora peruviana]|uniref:Uncharacterized protein n=1 Tax=Apodospora peruviana TaxID=516989 RepID=A0AAE0IKM7_9PEZI|nr:hypothetical protein B0H66DRAFT_618212 [Apodospora peruviana]